MPRNDRRLAERLLRIGRKAADIGGIAFAAECEARGGKFTSGDQQVFESQLRIRLREILKELEDLPPSGKSGGEL